MRLRVARSRAVVAAGYRPAVVARVAGISRQALYRRRNRCPTTAGPGGIDPDDQVIVEVAKANPTDGTRMVAALASRELGGRSTASGCSGSCAPSGCCSRHGLGIAGADLGSSGSRAQMSCGMRT